MARQFCRWDPELKIIGLRFSNVMDPEDYAAFPDFDGDPQPRKWNLWGYIDARDGAQAVRLRARARRSRGRRVRHRQRRHRDEHAVAPSWSPRCSRTWRSAATWRARDAAVDRQGPPRARLRPAALLARRAAGRHGLRTAATTTAPSKETAWTT